MNALCVHTPIGWICLKEEAGYLFGAAVGDEPAEAARDETPLLLEAKAQLDAYFSGSREAFDLPLALRATAFEKAVWRALLEIPYGQTRTYGEIAAAIGKPGAARAVGRACGKNPLLVFVPCHRVIGSGGKLTGFAAGLDRKRALLSHERRFCRRSKEIETE